MIECHDISYPLPFTRFTPGSGVPEDLQMFFFYTEALFESDINFMTGRISEYVLCLWATEMFSHRTYSSQGSRISF